ncbi:3,4-dihydroxy-2-butanone 4-phosphate synthase [Methanococcoides burtonii DSM 6242]|uniref:3,4-dihydroxy-2-butanone 4-phosphate synthase n=2 Tax=Methanococcoides burtonii TaxID=29291 RepID=Q12VB1_METBU|nr:3,4-dihydroxy-2-butanone-4-phosphate synthase [Methanococcoides burtonii]ABE52615.1 3,4-dihydroxy-2-butanone 4-phosphate synthase [Methanococcoides burtonii DSM 6242]
MTNENYTDNIKKAIKAAQNGEMFFIYDSDSREGETDFVITASSVTPDDVRWMRRDGGGLICVAIDSENSKKLGLPFISDVLRDEAKANPALGNTVEKGGDLAYDTRSSFSIWVNHRKTRTGIPDNDRALTINELSNITEKCMKGEDVIFGSEFRTPGHVALLRAADHLVHDRKGQTELSIAIAKMADVTPAMVVCEMLDDSNGRALSKKDAKEYAELHGLVFLEGQEIVDAYEQWEQA